MMLRPSYLDLINVVNKEAEPGKEPLIQSRYSIVIATAKRARQLIAGDEALVIENGRKPLSIAIDEGKSPAARNKAQSRTVCSLL